MHIVLGFYGLGYPEGWELGDLGFLFGHFHFCYSDFLSMSMVMFLMWGGEYVLGEKKKGSYSDSIPHNFIFK